MTALDMSLDDLRAAARQRPESYGGYWPGEHGYLPVAQRSRDSDPLEESNYAIALQRMQEIAGTLDPDAEPEGGYVHEHGASHWAVGWVEQLWVADHPELVAALESMRAALRDYPVLDDHDHAKREWEAFIDEIGGWIRDEIRYAAMSADHEIELDDIPAESIASAVHEIHGVSRGEDLPPMSDPEWLEILWKAADADADADAG